VEKNRSDARHGAGNRGSYMGEVEGMNRVLRDDRAMMITPNHMDWDGDVHGQDSLTPGGGDIDKALSAINNDTQMIDKNKEEK